MTDTFCPIPWNFQAIRANGDVRICCQANVTKNQGVIRKPDGTAYNAGRDDLVEARNAELMRIVRSNMLNGEWSEECGRCQAEEANGLVSRRSYENQQWPMDIDQIRKLTGADGSINPVEFPVHYYDLRFGNFCNLKCRMCGPTDSNAWYDDWIELTGTSEFKDTSGIIQITKTDKGYHVPQFEWYNYEPFWEQLEKNMHNIEHVYFAGGEPMLIERHYDFLERCVNSGAAKNMVIEYNTNMSTLPTRVLNLWKQFKQVRVGASVDGMGAVLEYQRSPAKWNKVLGNLQKVDALPGNVISWLAFTVTAYNVLHMIDFMKWKLTESNFKRINSSNRRPVITYHVAHHPKHLNIRVLPDAFKQEVVSRYTDFLKWIEQGDFNIHVKRHAQEIVKGVISYMQSESYNQQYWDEFVNYTVNLDKIRGENIFDVEPEFKKYI
jgi:MoaA/NifB/PqqE/SkfB family radical SAM enzyme